MEISKSFPCIVLYGPRQIGKSTTLDHIFSKTFNIVTLDDIDDRNLAQQNPKQFLDMNPWPVIIDEIQKAPELLDAIKIKIDEQRKVWLKNGEERQIMYILTGSNRFELQQGISDSLWLSILETSGIIYLLQPYMSNMSNRIIKAPKLYFMDTGLCAYLCKWP
ncbi:MAG: ATP-binding protein, partial [Treponema sp.]|nr:ATP-binding protein [Treponema sp.]